MPGESVQLRVSPWRCELITHIHNFPTLNTRWLEMADRKLRGLCQGTVECPKIADISDVKTSLSYCMFHFWRRHDELAWQTFERLEHRG